MNGERTWWLIARARACICTADIVVKSTSASRAVIGGALGALAADPCARGVAYEEGSQGQRSIYCS